MIATLIAAPTSSVTDPIREGGAMGGVVVVLVLALLLSRAGVQ